VTSIAGSAFNRSKINSISIEEGNERFVIDNDFLLDFDHKTLIRYFGSSSTILIPRNVEILCSSCFSYCQSLSSISFESDSKLERIEVSAFAGTKLGRVLVPKHIAFVAGNAFPTSCAVLISGRSSCREFIEWTSRRVFDSSLNFELPVGRKSMSELVVDLSGFVLVRVINKDSQCRVEIRRNRVNGNQIAVKCFPKPSEHDHIQEEIFFREIEALARLDHRCIVPFFGYVLQAPKSGPKLATHFMPGGSLHDVFESNPLWFTGTAKSIVAAGIVIGMISVHKMRIIHQDLKPSNVLFDTDRRPRISDFGSSRDLNLRGTLTGGGQVGTSIYMAPELYEEGDYDEKIDVYSLALILYEIVVGHPVFPPTLTLMQLCAKILRNERAEIPSNVEGFVAHLIRRGWSSDPAERPSFAEIYALLRQNDFRITSEDFDAREVASYVTWAGHDRTLPEGANTQKQTKHEKQKSTKRKRHRK
jgi:serine/threonine protein kinase